MVKPQDKLFILEKTPLLAELELNDFFAPGSFFPLWPWLVRATWSDPQISGKTRVVKRQCILMGGCNSCIMFFNFCVY